MAVCCTVSARGRYRNVARFAAGLFLLFAISDLLETQTGAWWNPWWLAVWKGGCLIGLLGCGLAAGIMRQRERAMLQESADLKNER